MKENKHEKLSPMAMFGDRKTIMEAFDYARMVIERSTDPSMNVYGTTALMVIWNTLSKNYEPLIRKTKDEPVRKTKD